MKARYLFGIMALVTVLFAASGAQAFTVTGLTYGDWARAEVNFVVVGNMVTIDIENTSQASTAILTGIAFNAEGVGSLDFFSGPTGWTGVYNEDGIHSPQIIGDFDVAGLTGNNFEGGDPQIGIGIGGTGHFEFTFDQAGNFWNEGSSGYPFVARFQAISVIGGPNDLSDVASVPIPAAVWLLGSGLVGLIGLRRKLQG